MSFSLTVFFEDPFWVGLFTISDGGTAQYCRVVFGGEPSDTEIYDFFNRNYQYLKFSPVLPVIPEEPMSHNPKKRQREVNKNLRQQMGHKKSYEIIKQSLISLKKDQRKVISSQKKKEHKDRITQIKQIKKKEKHRGH